MSSPLTDQENIFHTPSQSTAFGEVIEGVDPVEWWFVDIEKNVDVVEVIVTTESEPKWKTVQLEMQKKLKEWDIRNLDATKELHRRFGKGSLEKEQNRKRPSVQEIQGQLEKKLAKASAEVPKKVDLTSTKKSKKLYADALYKANKDFPGLFKNSCSS